MHALLKISQNNVITVILNFLKTKMVVLQNSTKSIPCKAHLKCVHMIFTNKDLGVSF